MMPDFFEGMPIGDTTATIGRLIRSKDLTEFDVGCQMLDTLTNGNEAVWCPIVTQLLNTNKSLEQVLAQSLIIS